MHVSSDLSLSSTWTDVNLSLPNCSSSLHLTLLLFLLFNATKTLEMGRRLLLLRWLTTTFLTALQVVTAKIYHAKGNFTSVQKSAFSVIMLALALHLGINFLVRTTCITVSALQILIRPTRRRLALRSSQRP